MHKSPEPQPLTRLNVTKHDRIWDKELPKGFFGYDTSNTLFSPPLKHITPETAEELWEKFDPLDLLIDSGSEKSESSSDTMIMMTTEELKRNEERIKNSFQEYEHRKTLKSSQINQTPQNFESQDFVVQSDFRNNNHKTSEEDFLNDEGYGTDSRTNTTASLSSPLSSSLSSLLTSESSSSQGSMQRNLNGNSRTQQIPSNGRLVLGHRQNIVAKKKIQPIEKQDNSLMEQLRALTTIQEEDIGGTSSESVSNNNHTVPRNNGIKMMHGHQRSNDYGNERGCYMDSPRSYGNDHKSSYMTDSSSYRSESGRYISDLNREERFNSDGGPAEHPGHGKTTYLNDSGKKVLRGDVLSHVRDGIFHAVPVKISQRNSVSQMEHIPVNRLDSCRQSESDKLEPNPQFWNGDTPHADSRLHPGDSVNSAGAVTPQRLSKHPSYMYSMPNLSGDPRSVTQDQVVMRRPKPPNSNYQNHPKLDLRYSWDCTDLCQGHSKFDVDSRNFSYNYSVKCEEPPKLSNQFRASSEMALQNGRPLFALSSDIYKLFQGQGNTGFAQGKQNSHRHSFHAMPSQSNFGVQPSEPSMEDMRNKLRAASTNGAPTRFKNGPIRASHELYKYSNSENIQQRAKNHKVRPSSIADTKEKLSTLV